MSYYPILKAPDCHGWATLCNFSPNNWESKENISRYVNVTWAEKGIWKSENLGILAPGAVRRICMEDLNDIVPQGTIPFLSLTLSKLPSVSSSLPYLDAPVTSVPAWRATLGLSTSLISTSYQGEIDPFPIPGSLLTIAPFIQYGKEIENYLICLNIEKSAIIRTAKIELYDAEKMSLKGSFELKNNDVTIIALDDLGYNQTDLPLIICREMSIIPLYFSKTSDGSFLSLEHTHPPASYVVHGRRWDVQKLLKSFWFSKEIQ